MVSERDSAVEHLPVGNEKLQKQAAQPFPQVFRAALLFPRRPEQRATALLHLINQEGEHRQLGEHRRQMLFAVAEVVFEAIALVLQGVESLVFDALPGAARTHQRLGVCLGDLQVGDPGKALLPFAGTGLPAFEEVHLQVEVRVVQRRAVEIAVPA